MPRTLTARKVRFNPDHAALLIKEARDDIGLSQSELARRAGISQPNLSQMEAGTRRPSAEMLQRILEAAEYRPSIPLLRVANEIKDLGASLGIHNIRVFGSLVRGEDRFDSDIDLLVSPDAGVSSFELGMLADRVEELTGFPVDVNTDTTTTEFALSIKNEAERL